jgi:O-antigen ligase
MLSKIITRATTVDESALARIDLFWYGFSIFKAHPVFGSGIETFLFSYKIAPHGDYMKMLAETGIFGGLGYLIILFTNLCFAVNNFKENDFAKISFLTIIGFMIFSLTDNALSYSHIFWGILGIYNGLIVRENFSRHPLLLAHNSNRSKHAVIL